jgi:peptide/nickel transport system substrate-binding protein
MNRFLIVFACVFLISCAPSKPASDITMAVAQAPLNLDPRYASDAASERVNRLLYQRLVEFDASAKTVAGIATWQIETPQRYVFSLKQNLAPFHHGKALTANDVKATYDSLLNLKGAPHTAEFENIAAIEVLSPQALVFTLKQPDPHFASKLILGILPQDLIASGHDFSHQPVGNGPIQFGSWQGDLVLKRVRDGKAIRITEVKDPTVRVLKLKRGEVDLLQGDLPPELVKYLESQDGITVKTSAGANFSYLGLNMQDPVLKSPQVRQAIAHAIDRHAIIKQVMVRNTRLAGGILPPEHYAGNASLKPYDYNPAHAKQLLQQAGVKLPLKLVYKTSTDAQRVRFATILQAQMAPAGIDLQIRSLDWGTFFEEVKQGQFQLFGLTWVGIKTPEIYAKAFGSQYFPPNGFNRGRFSDATLDALLAQEDWPAATQRIHAQLPYIPLWYEGQFAAYRNTISVYRPQPDGNWDGLVQIN